MRVLLGVRTAAAVGAVGALGAVAILASIGLLMLGASGCDAPDREGVSEAAREPATDPTAEALPAQQGGGVRVGSQAPNFQLYDLQGRLVTLSDYRGRIVFLNFWATWCGPCKIEMPAMEALYREFNRRDFEILAVSTDQQGVAVTRPFSNEMGLTFPILHDSDFRVGVAYGARTLPMTFLVDRRGVVTHRIFGARDWQSPEAHTLIKNLLSRR